MLTVRAVFLFFCGVAIASHARAVDAAPRAETGEAGVAVGVPLVSEASGLTLQGHHAYVVSSRPVWGWISIGQLLVLDLIDPDSPRRESAIDLYPFEVPRAIACQGSRVYVAGARLQVFDVSHPSAPESLGALKLPFGVTQLAVSGRHAYAVSGNGVHIVDVSDPKAPALRGSVAMPERIRDLALLGNHLAVSLDTLGIGIVDVRDPGAPAIVAFERSAPRARGLAARGERLYVASETAGLVVLDVSHPERPVVTGSAWIPGARKVTLQGSSALVEFVTWPATHLRVVDVSNPRSPILGDDLQLPRDTDTIDFAAARWVARMKSCRDDCIGGGDCCNYWIESGWIGAGGFGEGIAGALRHGQGAGSGARASSAASPHVVPDRTEPHSSTRIEEVRGGSGSVTPGATTIAFSLSEPGPASLKVFDVSGRRVAVLVDAPLPAGRHVARWDGRDRSGWSMPSGVYFLRLEAGTAMDSRTLVRWR